TGASRREADDRSSARANLPALRRGRRRRIAQMADEKDKEKAQKAPAPEKAAKPKRERAQQKGGGAKAAAPAGAQVAKAAVKELPARVRLRFEQAVAPALMRELKIENRMRVPRLAKITINMALNEARDNVKILDAAVEELSQITGQKPVLTRARKAISNFKL